MAVRLYSRAVALDIVMPFWGDPGHLREAVESVLKQTDPRWRLLVIDDVYPDTAPGEWVKALYDARVRFERNVTNLGPSRNYSKGVAAVYADFVVIMGCDDRMLPGFVARVHELFELHPDCDIVQPGVRVIDEHGDASTPMSDRIKSAIMPRGARPVALRGEPVARSLLQGNWTYFPSLVWRRSLVVGGFRPDLNVVQDLAKILEILFDDGTLVLDDHPVFEYRRHSTSVSARTAVDGSKYGQEATLFAEADAQARTLGWTRAARAARWHWTSRLSALSVVPAALRARHWQGVRALLRHSFSLPRPSPRAT